MHQNAHNFFPRSVAVVRVCGEREMRASGVRGGRVLAMVLCVLGGAFTSVSGQITREYDLKAALLYNFAQFVEWPPEAQPRDHQPFVIGVLGRDPFGRVLDEVVAAEHSGDRRIAVVRFQRVEAVRDCHILFVSASESADLPHIRAVLKNRPILSVGDFEDFATRGGMIRFKKSPEGKIQLRVNLEAVRAGGLTVSAKLLRLAEVVSIPEG